MRYFVNIFWKGFFLRGLFLCCLLAPAYVWAQPGTDLPPPDERVQIIKSDRATFILEDGVDTRYLAGRVKLFHKDAFLLCDSAVVNDETVVAYGNVVIIQDDTVQIFSDSLVYRGQTREADLYGDVVLLSGSQRMYSRHINYDMNLRVATYDNRSVMTDDKTEISSNRGQFFVNTNDAFFKDSVIIEDPQFGLKTDTLRYNTTQGIAFFLAPTIILQDSARIYCEGGYYDARTGKAEFLNTPQYLKADQRATADTMRYDRTLKSLILLGNAFVKDSTREARADNIRYDQANDDTWLEGHAYYRDKDQEAQSDTIKYNNTSKSLATRGRSKVVTDGQTIEANALDYNRDTQLGLATGEVILTDTSQGLTIRCDTLTYDRGKEYAKAWGNRPLLSTPLDNDTFWIRADTLIASRVIDSLSDGKADSVRNLQAYNHVRMFSKSYQGLADSLAYTGRDSVFTLYKDPILWSDTSQFVGDTIMVFTKNKKADRMALRNKAFLISADSPKLYNQVKGDLITAYLTEGVLERAVVNGSAESLYYARDENKAMLGLNHTTSGDLNIRFAESKVREIRFYGSPEGELKPLRMVLEPDRLLKDFRWRYDDRPKSVSDL